MFLLLVPLAPKLMKTVAKVYMRAQMVTSGKFMPAAYLPSSLFGWFDWNPLFHCIDQARLATFVNYNKEVSSMSYPIWFTAIFIVLGLMGELWSRKNLSASKHS
jgi:ABC-type polysaccharide/polyol phosphate export permease